MLVKAKIDTDFINKNQHYLVYAIEVDGNSIAFYVQTNDFRPYVIAHGIYLFNIIDFRNSNYWKSRIDIRKHSDKNFRTKKQLISFLEWEKDECFYYKLVEGEAVPDTFTEEEALSAIETFKRYKSLMDLEFAMPGITTFAEYSGKDNWLLCPKCIDAWEEPYINIHEMVKCPKCENTFLNPVKIDVNKVLP